MAKKFLGVYEFQLGNYTISLWKYPCTWEIVFDKYRQNWFLQLLFISISHYKFICPLEVKCDDCPDDAKQCFIKYHNMEE